MTTRHPRTAEGRHLDATFEVERTADGMAIILHHSAGARGTAAAVNTDYAPALELLLERLQDLGARIDSIMVDSSVARARPETERVVALPYPVTLVRRDVEELRVRITEGMRAVARRPGARPGGGNNRKRIRIAVSGDALPTDPARLADHLARPPDQRGR